jgi:leucyl aminopeptidase
MVRMRVEVRDVLEIDTPLLALGVFEDQDLNPLALRIDDALGGVLQRLKVDGEISGKRNTATVLHTTTMLGNDARVRAARVAVIGRGKSSNDSLESSRWFGAAAALKARELHLSGLTLIATDHALAIARESAQALAEGVHLALYRYDRFKNESEGDRPAQIDEVLVVGSDHSVRDEIAAGVRDGELLAAATMLARDLATGPANLVSATYLGEQAREIAGSHGLTAQIFDKTDLTEMGCGGILAVNQGSAEPPVMGVLRYDCGGANAKTLAVIGKGITFDTGGISIKPANNMHFMRHDKSGAAAVIGFLQAAATLKLPVNVLGVFAATDNMPSGSAYRPGDVIKSYSGKYMEIHNTDAEGRVVLADALAYAVEQRPDAMIDLATLTGACVTALGHVCSGLFTNRDDLASDLIAAGDRSGERVWRMPLWEEYREQIKAPLGEFKNVGGTPAGSITAAWFLANFVGDVPWAHLDIAGTGWTEGSWAYMPPYLQKDIATGVGVRLLTHFAKAWA